MPPRAPGRYDVRMLRVPEAFASSTVLDQDGNTHQVGSFWADGPVVLVFLRHFA